MPQAHTVPSGATLETAEGRVRVRVGVVPLSDCRLGLPAQMAIAVANAAARGIVAMTSSGE